MSFLFYTPKSHCQFKDICAWMTEVVAEASVSPSSSFCLDLSFLEPLGRDTHFWEAESWSRGFGVTWSGGEPWLWHFLYGLKKIFNPCLYFFIWKVDYS